MTSQTEPADPNPLVSVVIAAYRADAYLEEAIRDALSQTYPAVEVIVSDDAASEATRAVVMRVGGGKVIYRANPTRLGAAGNHWAAIRSAHGEWIAILNHDDRWSPTFLSQVMAAVAECPDSVVGFCDHHVITPAGEPQPARADAMARMFGRDRLAAGKQPSLLELAVRQTIPVAMGAVFRKSAVDVSSPPDVGPAYDFWLTYLLAHAGGSAVYVPARLTSWREHPRNLTSAGGQDWLAGAARCWEAMAQDPAFASVRDAVRSGAASSASQLAKSCLRSGQYRKARVAARAALNYHATDWRIALTFFLTLLPGGFGRWLLAQR